MRPVSIVAKVIVGLRCPPVEGAIAQMKRLRRKMFVIPTYAATCKVSKLPIVVWIIADVYIMDVVPTNSMN